jgi:hypothetical protein
MKLALALLPLLALVAAAPEPRVTPNARAIEERQRECSKRLRFSFANE